MDENIVDAAMRATDPNSVIIETKQRLSGGASNFPINNVVLCVIADASYYTTLEHWKANIVRASKRIAGMIWVWMPITKQKGKNPKDDELASRISSIMKEYLERSRNGDFRNSVPKLIICPRHGNDAGMMLWTNDVKKADQRLCKQSPEVAIRSALQVGFKFLVLCYCHSGRWIDTLSTPQEEVHPEHISVASFEDVVETICSCRDDLQTHQWSGLCDVERYLLEGAPTTASATKIVREYVRVVDVRPNMMAYNKRFVGKRAIGNRVRKSREDEEMEKKREQIRIRKLDTSDLNTYIPHMTHEQVIKTLHDLPIGTYFRFSYTQDTIHGVCRGHVKEHGSDERGCFTSIALRVADGTGNEPDEKYPPIPSDDHYGVVLNGIVAMHAGVRI